MRGGWHVKDLPMDFSDGFLFLELFNILYDEKIDCKLEDAFKDKDNRGFAWNNLMLQRWVDHNGDEHRVLEDYERNRRLIDLSEQPADIKEKIFATIKDNIEKEKNVSQVGIRLLKFCQLYDLKKISDQAQQYAEPLNARYHQ